MRSSPRISPPVGARSGSRLCSRSGRPRGATASGGRIARVVREIKRPGLFRLEFSTQGTTSVFAHEWRDRLAGRACAGSIRAPTDDTRNRPGLRRRRARYRRASGRLARQGAPGRARRPRDARGWRGLQAPGDAQRRLGPLRLHRRSIEADRPLRPAANDPRGRTSCWSTPSRTSGMWVGSSSRT